MGIEELNCLSDKGWGSSGDRDWQLRPTGASSWHWSPTCRSETWTLSAQTIQVNKRQ